MTHISYQLYCSRNSPPLSETLKMLSAAGFKEVEGYGALFDDVDAVKAAFEDTDLKMTSSHIGLDLMEGDPAKAIEIIRDFGMRAAFVPYLQEDERPTDAAGWTAFGERLAKISEPFVAAGIKFGWHNHDFELVATETGEMPLDLMMAAAPDMMLELDLGWVTRAGEDPVAWINKYAGRIAAAHIKDVAPAGENTDEDGWADVGHGTMDWAAIHAALQAAGVDHYVVEHDNPSDHQRMATRSLASASNF
ncbi:sugar phosphate isomerase/epimerase [Loktanella sp. F6476L]|uniref:sugar phosphate isomerase/epimerase family protein n=1 Tax=Loktanella sp. F6476L TaxID=2926405 RepID=UPI001FF6C94C|nr:sugar phosphate isomerase/epimerase [Loktanella sp. F6476L]MCK0121891.1 sugar phosphate isomerase/epimerase [Loktanella sp. F6476L]